VNGWLGSDKLKTPYKLVVRSLVAADQLKDPLAGGLEAIADDEDAMFLGSVDKDGFVMNHYPPRDDARPFFQDVDASAEVLAKAVESSDIDRIRELVLVDQRTSTVVTHRDVGIGISQVLPVLVMAYGSRGKLLAMEQPEIHLHPALQAELADVFIEAALGPRLNTFILETHSEHLILRLMRRIREGKVSSDDIGVVFVEPLERGSRFLDLRIDDDGDFIDEWPGGFFEESFHEKFAGR
jgi:predicted ATPase